MLSLGAKLEFPGSVFPMSSAGAKRSKTPPFEDVRGGGLSENVTQGQSQPTQNSALGSIFFVKNKFPRKYAMYIITHVFN